MVLQGNIYAETYGPLTISCLYRTQHTCLIGSGVISFRTTVTHIVCLSSLFFYPKRIYGFSASFAIFRRKALQPLTQSIACAIAKLCIRQRKALHPPTQSIAQFDVQISAATPDEPNVAGWKERQREGNGKAKGKSIQTMRACQTAVTRPLWYLV